MPTDIKEMRGKLGFLPLQEPMKMPPEALNHFKLYADDLGETQVSMGAEVKKVKLFCNESYWSEEFGCVYHKTFFTSPWTTQVEEGPLLLGWRAPRDV